jgi:hypothetical protein
MQATPAPAVLPVSSHHLLAAALAAVEVGSLRGTRSLPDGRYALDPEDAFDSDLERVEPFHLGRMFAELDELEHQAEAKTRNRKVLKAAIPWCPRATWEVRVDPYRVLYRVDGTTVHLLAVGLKVRNRLLPVRPNRAGEEQP